MNITHKAARLGVGKTIDKVIDSIHNDPQESLLNLVDWAQRIAGGMYREDIYDQVREMIQDPDNKWMKYLENLIDTKDHNIIKTMTLNLGFEAAFYGNKKLHKNRKKYGCNIPWVILFDPTSACNLKCKGCWAAEYGHKMNLSFELMDRIVTEGKELGTHFYMLTGGEPLVRKADILKLAEKHNDCAFNIFTNGTLIDEEFCQEVKRLGNIVFSVSVEGFENENDIRRGEGSFAKVMKAMDIMNANGIGFGTSICYTQQNYKTVTDDDFLDMLIEKGSLFNWYFHYMPVGNKATQDLLLTKEAREYMYHRVREIRGLTGGKPIFAVDFQNDGEYVGGCIAGGKYYFHINANGDVEPCVFIHYSNVNIKDCTILEALQSPIFMAYKEGQPFNDNHLKPCPMLENPGLLTDMVNKTNAKSTDLESPENAEHLCNKCIDYSEQWNETADKLWIESINKKKLKNEQK